MISRVVMNVFCVLPPSTVPAHLPTRLQLRRLYYPARRPPAVSVADSRWSQPRSGWALGWMCYFVTFVRFVVSRSLCPKEKPPGFARRLFVKGGIDLLSRVSSTIGRCGLTSVFGMGTGVARSV